MIKVMIGKNGGRTVTVTSVERLLSLIERASSIVKTGRFV